MCSQSFRLLVVIRRHSDLVRNCFANFVSCTFIRANIFTVWQMSKWMRHFKSKLSFWRHWKRRSLYSLMPLIPAKDMDRAFKIAIKQSTTTIFGVIAPVYLQCNNQQLIAPVLCSDDIICDIGNWALDLVCTLCHNLVQIYSFIIYFYYFLLHRD